MNNKEKLLRIRPFNMANFSGGSGYMPLWAMMGAIVSLPAMALLWTGMAISLRNVNGMLDYNILKKRLNSIVLPICLVLFIPCVILFSTSIYGSILVYGPAALFGALVPTIGIYCSLFFSAKLLDSKGSLSKGKWFLLTLGIMALLAISGFFIFSLLVSLGDFINNLLWDRNIRLL